MQRGGGILYKGGGGGETMMYDPTGIGLSMGERNVIMPNFWMNFFIVMFILAPSWYENLEVKNSVKISTIYFVRFDCVYSHPKQSEPWHINITNFKYTITKIQKIRVIQ